MKKSEVLRQIAAFEKERNKLIKHFESIVNKDDNGFEKNERIDIPLYLIKDFENRINELKALIE
jgi:hypothetical protein